MRYFFFSYSWSSTIELQSIRSVYTKTEAGFGSFSFCQTNFPSQAEVKRIAKASLSYKTSVKSISIIITNWNEFKNKNDFDNFQSQDDEVKT